MIQHLLREARSEGIDEELVSVTAEGFGGAIRLDEPGPAGALPRSPGGGRASTLPTVSRTTSLAATSRPSRCSSTPGPGRKLDDRGAGERAERSRRAGGYHSHARDVHLVLRSRAGTAVPFHVLVDGEAPGAAHGLDVDEQGRGTLVEPRLYQLIRQAGSIDDRTFEIAFDAPGVEAYALTFG